MFLTSVRTRIGGSVVEWVWRSLIEVIEDGKGIKKGAVGGSKRGIHFQLDVSTLFLSEFISPSKIRCISSENGDHSEELEEIHEEEWRDAQVKERVQPETDESGVGSSHDNHTVRHINRYSYRNPLFHSGDNSSDSWVSYSEDLSSRSSLITRDEGGCIRSED